MAIDVDGATIETNDNGHLVHLDDWSEAASRALAAAEGIELTERHWDLINYLRAEYIDNRENQPNTRTICKAMSDLWGEKVGQSEVYALFPLDPSKQGGKVAGLPESRRKGGY